MQIPATLIYIGSKPATEQSLSFAKSPKNKDKSNSAFEEMFQTITSATAFMGKNIQSDELSDTQAIITDDTNHPEKSLEQETKIDLEHTDTPQPKSNSDEAEKSVNIFNIINPSFSSLTIYGGPLIASQQSPSKLLDHDLRSDRLETLFSKTAHESLGAQEETIILDKTEDSVTAVVSPASLNNNGPEQRIREVPHSSVAIKELGQHILPKSLFWNETVQIASSSMEMRAQHSETSLMEVSKPTVHSAMLSAETGVMNDTIRKNDILQKTAFNGSSPLAPSLSNDDHKISSKGSIPSPQRDELTPSIMGRNLLTPSEHDPVDNWQASVTNDKRHTQFAQKVLPFPQGNTFQKDVAFSRNQVVDDSTPSVLTQQPVSGASINIPNIFQAGLASNEKINVQLLKEGETHHLNIRGSSQPLIEPSMIALQGSENNLGNVSTHAAPHDTAKQEEFFALFRQLNAVVQDGKNGSYQIHLTPHELGRVKIEVGKDENHGIKISIERQETMALFQKHIQQLSTELSKLHGDQTRVLLVHENIERSDMGKSNDGTSQQSPQGFDDSTSHQRKHLGKADIDISKPESEMDDPKPVVQSRNASPVGIDIRL